MSDTPSTPSNIGLLALQNADDFLRVILGLTRMIQPSGVMILSSRLDHALREAILTKMRQLSNRAKDRLFDGHGPLQRFSAKVDMAFALSLFDDQVYSDLKIINEIRNEFAHPKLPIGKMTNFANDPILSICKKFDGFDSSQHPMAIFLQRSASCLLAISKDEDDIKAATLLLSAQWPDDRELFPDEPAP